MPRVAIGNVQRTQFCRKSVKKKVWSVVAKMRGDAEVPVKTEKAMS